MTSVLTPESEAAPTAERRLVDVPRRPLTTIIADSGSVGIAALALVGLFAWAWRLDGSVLSYFGLSLLLQSSIALIFASISAACVIMVGDIDLGLGNYVALINVVVAAYLSDRPLLGITLLIACLVGYTAVGLLVELAGVPAIVATLGAAFIWFGVANLILPAPGGLAPTWLTDFIAWDPPLLPLPIWIAIVVAAVTHVALFHTRTGLKLRALGSNRDNVVRSGASALKLKLIAYLCAGLAAIAAGFAITGVTGTGDSSGSAQYTLLAIGGVILGGGELTGGRVSMIGAVIGAVSLSMVGVVVALIGLSSVWQSAVVGVVLIVIVALRRVRTGLEGLMQRKSIERQRRQTSAVVAGEAAP